MRNSRLASSAASVAAARASGVLLSGGCDVEPSRYGEETLPDGGVEARVIDLEKSRWRPSKVVCAIRDLYTLNYHSQMWSRSDRLWFFRSYLQLERLTPFAKWLWRTIAARSGRKQRIQPPVRVFTAKAGVVE